jgi:protein-S-isoprenylcysteine O-methyltransferase Ste14
MLRHKRYFSGVRLAFGGASMFAPLRSVRSQKLALVHRELEQNAPIVAYLAGLPLPAAGAAPRLGTLGVLALGLLGLLSLPWDSSGAALACFLIAALLRFGFLFASFAPRGVAPRLVARFGVEKGHRLYAMALDLLLFAQRASFVALAYATARDPSGPFGYVLQALGFLLVPVGIGATFWAARSIGRDAYHYRDLFTGSRTARIEDGGLYALCHDPMYALGPLTGYGLALLALSPLALFAAGVHQALLLVFNRVIEQPRLRRANNIFVETQRRYDLARSLLGFDPRQELTRRRHSDRD